MKRNYVMMAMAAAMLASCAQTGLVEEIAEEPQKAIGFSTFVDKATRADGGANTTNLHDYYTTFNVYGWKNVNSTWIPVFENVTNEYFTSKNVSGTVVYTNPKKPADEWTSDGGPAWYYENVRYWDKLAGEYQFCAYAPITASPHVTATSGGEINIGDNTSNTTTITVDDTNLQATPGSERRYKGFLGDYMTATAKNTTIGGIVSLEFTHELAKLNVKIQKTNTYSSAQALNVTKFEILNLKNQGAYTRTTSGDSWEVYPSSSEGVYKMNGTLDLKLKSGYYVIEQLLLPQSIKKATKASSITEFVDEECVHITYTVGTEEFNGYYALSNIFDPSAAEFPFVGGYEYTLTITVGPEPIQFTTSVTAWIEGEGSYTIQ